MRLCSLHIARLPGIRPGFTLDGVEPGVNVVVGPNASGKTSLLRALRAALYREELRHDTVDVEATFEDASGTLRAVRVGADLHWTRAGERIEAPPLPDYRFLSCYTLRIEDLLSEDQATDGEIAEHLARDLAGGYDIRSIRGNPPFSLKTTHAKREAQELASAERMLRRRIHAHHVLRQEEARLEDLRQRKQEAEEAGRETERYERALALLEARRHRRALEAQCAEFPEGMERLRGDELETLTDLHEQLRKRDSDRNTARQDRASAGAALERSRLADAELDEGVLADHHRILQRLQRLETRVSQKRSDLAEAQAEFNEAVESLGGEPARTVRLDPATTHEVEHQLSRKRELHATTARLEEELTRLPSDPDPDLDLERLRAGRRELYHWLAAPRDPDWTPMRIATIAVVLASAAAGIIAAGLSLHWSLLGLLLPFGAGAYLLLRRGTGEVRRTEARERFCQLGLPEPESWETVQIRNRLNDLDALLQKAERQAAQLERRAEAERELAASREALDEVLAHLRVVAEEVGYNPESLDASLERWIRLTERYDRTRAAVASIEADRDRLAAESDGLRADFSKFLADYGEAPDTQELDSETLSARFDRLSVRLQERERAKRAIDDADREISRVGQAITEIDRQIDVLFERAGLKGSDEPALRQRLERLEAWKTVQERLRGTHALERDREQQLSERADLMTLAEADDEGRLRKTHDELRGRADGLESWIQEITRIESAIDQAGRERELETARAQRQHAEEALRDRLEEALFAEAGRFLIEEVEAEHVRESQPAALRRAAEWFERFTRHDYELIFETEGHHRFAALETVSGERRKLSELSSGTRMQLLLAVRVAFALEAERGRECLPLVLDEALTTADPERFQAAATSLRALAETDGRQVFYLTAQPADARYWTTQDATVHCIDLAELRGRGSAITDSACLVPAEQQEIPHPAGDSPEEYAVKLGVPSIDPGAEVSEIHVFYLLRDDLELLRQLLQRGIERLGPLRSLLASETADSLLSKNELQCLRARAAATGAWIDAWRHGRARPVDRHALERSGAVSVTFIDRVSALNDELDGDGRALVRRLGDGAVSRFRADKREQLETWLSLHGYIDSRGLLSQAEMELRVIAALQANGSEAGSAVEEGRLLAASLASGLRAAS